MRQKQIGEKNYVLDEKLDELAKIIIEKEEGTFHFTKNDDINIGYMTVFPNITTTTAGRCIKASKELKFFSNFDYVIQVSGELWTDLTDEAKYNLLWHELLHIYVHYNKKGTKFCKLRDHDLKDFRIIVERHGLDWLKIIELSTASLYDLDDNDVKIKL